MQLSFLQHSKLGNMHLYTKLCALAASATALATADARFAPDKVHAEKNAHAIFNSIHSAGRQWGSSIYHNGFALIPVVVPRGSVFYHGAATKEQPAGPEWLAFEPEAAEAFGSDWSSCRGSCEPSSDSSATAQASTSVLAVRSYVHTYRNKRDLKLLLVDGMSGAKTNYGTLDTQDLVLLEGRKLDQDQFEDESRAQELCKVVQPWGYDGLIRAELGFEIINCNFTGTVTQMKVKSTFFSKDKAGDDSMRIYQWARAAGQRYDGLGARLKFDFSSMVSGLFYPINTTNPDPSHPEFKRLAATPMDNLRVIKNRVAEIAKADFQTFLIDWRYIVDTVVERFSDRLAAMADEDVGDMEFINEIEAAATSYVDAMALESDGEDAPDQDAFIKQSIKDCMDHYLYPALPFSGRWNQADHMLYHSVITVTSHICTTFIQGWRDLRDASSSHKGGIRYSDDVKQQRTTLHMVKSQVRQLMSRLGWAPWRKTRPCPVDEAMFVAMWPYGDKTDHFNPGCRKRSQLVVDRNDYWNLSYVDASGETPTFSSESEEL
ncbi:uncharacterized protein LMH87_008380 [Akanthomyces muscarius]|uniref:Uncharacterized protein n=1 Tax=Akanthomyces muscarius TaxID=2231603 RepID=A0A9W8UQY7_AKAMU|nr:uncharacterized protein LMH87_008380 [Akanthomyces muscarius]KAJ4159480.1 hypothetical protein LMH87_008380 [Akanthomyces muscarius]